MSDNSIASRTRGKKIITNLASVSEQDAHAGEADNAFGRAPSVDDAVASTSREVAGDAPIVIENRRRRRRQRAVTTSTSNVRISRSIFGNYTDFLVENPHNIIEFGQFLLYCVPHIEEILRSELKRHTHIKCNFVMSVLFRNALDISVEYAYRTRNDILVSDLDVSEFVANNFARMLALIDEHQLSGGSGFAIEDIRGLEIHSNKLKMLRPKSYIPLPKWLKAKHAIVNPKNKDAQCFKHVILARHFTGTNQNRISRRHVARFERLYDFSNIKFPVSLKQVKKFANQNNMTINVYGLEKKHIYPIIVNKTSKENHVNLLYLSRQNKSHYALIKCMSRLLSAQVSRHNGRMFFCNFCLLHFQKKVSLDAHTKVCGNEQLAAVVLPAREKAIFKFSKQDAAHLAPLFCVCDYECLVLPIDTCIPDPKTSFTSAKQLHQPLAFGAYLVSNVNTDHVPQLPLKYFHCISTSEKQLCRQIYKYFVRVAKAAKILLNSDFPINASRQDRINHANASECYVCGHGFTEEDGKILEHTHYVQFANVRGSAHFSCNLKMHKHKFIVFYFHNLKGYDGHMLIKMFSARKIKVNVLAITLEKYMTFSVVVKNLELRFMDSALMLNASLDVVSATLSTDEYIEMRQNFPVELHSMLYKKAPFPYSFLSSAANLKVKTFPDIVHFKNDLSDEEISPEEYQRARDLYEKGKCENFQQFLLQYLKSDVLILADCLIAARKLFWQEFSLDILGFFSLPHLTLSCMLKLSKVKLELLDDTMCKEYDLVKRSLYGGMTFSNVKYFESDKEGFQCVFLDAVGKWFFYNIIFSCITFNFKGSILARWKKPSSL